MKGREASLAGGYIPFAQTKAQRTASGDPRLSIEERYGTLEGYVCVVEKAAAQALAERFLLKDDADRLVREAKTSDVLPREESSTTINRDLGRSVCAR